MLRVRPVLVLSLVAILTAGIAAPADAAKRKVPFGFFGTVLPPEMGRQISDAALDRQMAVMARSGVESVRITFDWGDDLERTQGAYDLPYSDRLVAAAARHGIAVLMNVTSTPIWISERPNNPEWRRYPPRRPGPFADLMRQLVLRYGPSGTLWSENPSLPKVPVRQWQIWNEQTAPWHWRHRPWAPGYTQLLKAAYKAINGLDSGATVVAGSLVAVSANYAPWDAMRDLYQAGAKRWFDAVAVHPFTNDRTSVRRTVWQTVEIIRRVRAQMRRAGDGRKPVLITEMTWPASAGKVPRKAQFGLETSARGQAARLRAAYTRLIRLRRKMRIQQVHWYNWATQYNRVGSLSVMTFRYSGLSRMRNGVFSGLPLLRSYARLAARYQGCRKSADARSCR